MKTIINHKPVMHVTSKIRRPDMTIKYTHSLLLYVGWTNPVGLPRLWMSKIPAGGFYFLGLRVSWTRGKEIRELRTIINH